MTGAWLSLQRERNSRQAGWISTFPLIALALLGFALSLALVWQERRVDNQQIRNLFNERSHGRIEDLKAALRARIVGLEILALDLENEEPNWDRFRHLSQPLISHFSDIQRIQWIPNVPEDQLNALLSRARKEFPDFRVHRDTDSVDLTLTRKHLPILYSYPNDGEQGAQGLDLSSMPELYPLLDHAQESRHWVATSVFGDPLDEELEAQMHFYHPVVRLDPQGKPLLSGYVAIQVEIPKLFANASPELSGGDVNLLVYDLHRYSNQPLYRSNDDLSEPANDWLYSQVIDLPGHPWLVRSEPSREFLQTHRFRTANTPLLIALMVTLLMLAALSWRSAHARPQTADENWSGDLNKLDSEDTLKPDGQHH